MALRVFISYTISDTSLIMSLKNILEPYGIAVYTFEADPQPGRQISAKIKEAIEQSDLVLALMSIAGDRSKWVRDEMSYATGKGKKVIMIVEEGVTVGGMHEGIEHIPFSRYRPLDAINQAAYDLVGEKVKKESGERSNAIFWVILAALALIGLSGRND